MLTRYSPFNDLFANPFSLLNTLGETALQHNDREADSDMNALWAPRVDVKETEEALVFSAEVPGLSEDDLEIEVEKNVLTLKGKRELENTTEGDKIVRRERFYGSFERRFKLPDTVTAQGVTADLKHGLLTLTFPKVPDVKPMKISLSKESEG